MGATIEMGLAEQQRQRALESYRVMDTLPEGAYDSIVRLASLICDVPIALLSFIDRERQWFKASLGTDMRETPREIAFCDQAIRDPGQLLEVEDASQDPRFADNPLVVGGPGVRFYAGMPILTADGQALGTVCVLDSQPHVLTDGQREGLRLLSQLTMQLLESRRNALHLERRHAERDFAQRPAQETVAGTSIRFAVAVVEVDGIAGFRAEHGQAGLARLQQTLQECLPNELVCPHGESEYLVILSQGAHAHAQLVALCDSIASREALSLTIGAAIAEGAEEAMELVFERADEALALARRQRGARRLVVDGQIRDVA